MNLYAIAHSGMVRYTYYIHMNTHINTMDLAFYLAYRNLSRFHKYVQVEYITFYRNFVGGQKMRMKNPKAVRFFHPPQSQAKYRK